MSANYKDYYKTLGVDRDASEKEIKSAYRKAARKFHPDVNPDDKESEERFKEISEAHEVLSDKEKRAKYDQFGQYWDQVGAAGPGGPAGPGPGGAEYFTFDFGDFGAPGPVTGESGFSDFFEQLFGGGQRAGPGAGTRRAPARGRNIRAETEISLEDAFHGAKKTFTVDGRRIEVTIPKGVHEGQSVRLAGQGEDGPAGKGDLFIKINIRSHPRYERRDDDLYVDVPVDYLVAALGGEAQVPTLSGRVTMKMPPNTSGGKTFRLPGQGMPKLKKTGRGNLYARVRVTMPESMSDGLRKALEELRNARQAGSHAE